MSLFERVTRRFFFEIKIARQKLWLFLIKNIPFLRVFYKTRDTFAYVSFRIWFIQKILGFNKHVYWPVHYTSVINVYKNIYVGVGSAPGLSPGCYIQGIGKVYIGDYTGLGPNVGVISANHHMFDMRKYYRGVVRIGNYCWVGMNSVILPDVELGDFTIVQAGSVVKDSFKEGYCVIGGNPAKLIKKFPEESYHLFERYRNNFEYHGYIPKEKFEEYRKRNLWV